MCNRRQLESFWRNRTAPSAARTGLFLLSLLISDSASLMRVTAGSDFQPNTPRRKPEGKRPRVFPGRGSQYQSSARCMPSSRISPSIAFDSTTRWS